MAIKATGRATFMAVEDYDIVFVLNGIRCDVLNFDSVRTAESAALEADFYNGGDSCVVDKAVLCCYDGEGTLLGSPIEVHDTSIAVADGGNLYLSKDCKTITCDIYAGDKKLLSKTLPVIRDGSSVGVKAVSYKVINNVTANASLNWDSVTSQTAYPTQKPDKGKYCYVMTIVLYTDGTSTNTVSTSYTPNDGTSVKVASTKVEYVGSDSGTTTPSSGWQTAVPQLAQGKYLWTRTTVSYSDNNSTTSYSVGRIGMDGSKGGTTHILYASSASPKSPNDVKTVIDSSHQYYGTYQDTEVNDDVNKYTSVGSWVLIKGEKGDTPPMYSLNATAGNNDIGNDSRISFNGKTLATSVSRGHTIYFLRGGVYPSVAFTKSYDTYGTPSLATDIATYLTSKDANAYNDCVLVIIGFDALTVNDDLRNALKSYGYGGDNLLYNVSLNRTSFVFIGQKGMTEGTAYYKMSKISKVSLTASVSNGVLVGTGHKGEKGDTPTVAKLRVDHSVCHFSRTSNTWDFDTVTVSIVIMNGGKTEIPAYGDTTKYFWRLSTDGISVKRSSGDEFDASLTASSITVNLYKTGSDENVAIDTITVPMVFDGKDGEGTPGVSYRLVPMSDRSATVKASNSSTNATFTLHYTLHYKAVKMVGDRAESATIATIAATIEDKMAITTVNKTEGTLSGTGTKSYTSDNRPADSIPVTVTLSDGTVLYDNVPVTMEAGVAIDINKNLATVTQTAADNKGNISTIQQTAKSISLKVQDLQNGGIDTSKPHTSSQVDFRTLDINSFYPVMIRFKDDGGVRHTVEINRPLDAAYGSGKSYMTNGQGFSFRLIFSDIANDWGSREDGQLRIESISQRWTTPTDTPICPRIAQYYPFSFMVAWLRGGSKYDITVDCTDAYISGIWPYMTQVASNPSLVPDAVRLAPNTWTTAQVNAQGGNPYNLLKKDNGGYYADTDNEYLYRFGKLAAGNTFAIVGQPTDSKQWFIASWKITRVSGSKVYVDSSTYEILWQTQNPLGIRMNGELGYIKTGASYSKSTWDSQSGFGTSEDIDNSAVHASWLTTRPILVIGKESSATNGVYRDRAVLESVQSCEENDEVGFSANTYFDISPLYGTGGRVNVKPDLLATGIDIKNKKIVATTDNFVVRNNSGVTTFSIDEDGNIVGAGNAHFKGTITGSTINGSTFISTSSDGSTSVTKIEGGQITTNNINAKGGSVSFFKFDGAGMYSGNVEDDGKIYSGLGMSMNNLSVSGNSNNRISSVFLGSGWKDSRYTNSDNYRPYRVGSTTLASEFYNYIKLERIGSGSYSFENDPTHAALGIETQGDFCLAALGGPSQFAGMCLSSDYVSSGATADKKHCFYQCSGGDFTMPSNPPTGLFIVVIHTGSYIRFYGNGKKFRFGTDYRDTCESSKNGEWAMFYYDGSYWNAVMINVSPW